MHQRHNIRHNIHQAPMMRPPHLPSQMNVSLGPHPQQVSMQPPPPQIQTQQQPAPQPQQHTNISISATTQILSQYIPPGHQRGDPNRLGHHLPQGSQQQQQPQQSQQQAPAQVSLQQPQLAQPQRISPQMHQAHYMKSRPPNINNNSNGGVNVNNLQQQHPQLQPPPSTQPTTTSNINNQQLQQQTLIQQIPAKHQQLPQHQIQQIPLQQHNNNSNHNNYNQKLHHGNKAANHQNHKYNNSSGNAAIPSHSKMTQSKHGQTVLQPSAQPHHQQPVPIQHPAHQQKMIPNAVIQTHQQPQMGVVAPQPQNIQPHSNQCSSQAVSQITNQIQNSHPKIVQSSNKIINTTALANTVPSSSTSTQNCSASNAQSSVTTSQTNPNIPTTNVSNDQQKITKTNNINTPNTTEQSVQSDKSSKKHSTSGVKKPAATYTNIEPSENNEEASAEDSFGVPSTENISSGKEKTPMCLVNELARYNQIQHQYRLTGEQGPAHSKKFTVILKLGDEEYTAEGLSIKKAQHTAAAEAFAKTKYEHPPPKKIRHKNGSTRFGNITPTVELNALAMKLGQKAVYVYVFDSPDGSQPSIENLSHVQSIPTISQTGLPTTIQMNPSPAIIPNSSHSSIPTALPNGPAPPPPAIPHIPNYYCENNYQYGQFNSRNNLVNFYINGNGMRFPGVARRPYGRGGFIKYRNRMMPPPFNGIHPSFHREACKITLLVGKQKFTGVGPTVQAAKHDAASKALEVLKPISESSEDADLDVSTGEADSEIKSPISMVYEIGLKRSLLVSFEVKSEVGPPHLKNFITICRVGEITTEGEGNGKKISKKRAAKKMLEELKKLPPLSPEKPPVNTYQNNNSTKSPNKGSRGNKRNSAPNAMQQGTTQAASTKKRTKNVIKEKSEPENPEEINPISRLIQIQQALKEREPVYTVIEEKGAPRRREFTIEVKINGQSATGSGSNKKIAKKNAAKSYETNSSDKENNLNVVNTAEHTNKAFDQKDTSQRNSNNSTKLNQPIQSGSSSRQIVPGLIQLPKNKKNDEDIKTAKEESNANNDKNLEKSESSNKPEADEPEISKDESPEINNKESEKKSTEFGVRPKDQLLYLAQLLGFEANFTDYPKGNHGEYLTIVALFTDPPQLCHGAGENTDASQDSAALAALQMLSKLGLDNVKPKKSQSNTNTSSNTSEEKKSNVTADAKN